MCMLSEKDKIDILQIIDKKLETEMHFHNAGFHNIEPPPTTEKSCVRCKKDKPVFCLHCLNDIKKAEFLIDTVPTQTDEDVLTGIIETQLNARKYRSKQFDIENKELAQEILKHFMRIKKG